jgi:phospholipase C
VFLETEMKSASVGHSLSHLAAMLLMVVFLAPTGIAQSTDVIAPEDHAEAAANARAAAATGINKIQHVVFIVKENRSFNEYFGAFPGATGSTTGLLSTGATIPLGQTPDAMPYDICHDWACLIAMMDYGKMDHYDLDPTCTANGIFICFTQHQQADIPNYFAYAKNFTLGDHMFSSIHASSFPNHLYTIAAGSGGIVSQGHLGEDSAVGCTSPAGGIATVIDQFGNVTSEYPCIDITTMGDLLNTKGLSWSSYAPPHIIFNAYTAINHIYNTSQWAEHIVPYTNFPADALAGNLPAVSWVVANHESEHPTYSTCYGENWTVNQINAVMQGPLWNSTAIFLMWDDPGGFYDAVPPPAEDVFGPGQRVGFIIISPYAKSGYISHTTYEASSVLKFIEELFGLPNLTQRDLKANDMLDSFNFNQTPLAPLVLQPQTCPFVVSSQNFQPQQVGTSSPQYSLTYVNQSTTVTDTVISVAVSGTDFTQTNNCGAVIPGFLCNVYLTFTPTAVGPRTATVTITDKLTGGSQTQHTVSLTGIGSAIAISPPGVINFGTQSVGTTSVAQVVTLSNGGTAPLAISGITITGNFAQTNTCGTSVPAQSSCMITVTFTPTAAGNRPGTITINDSDPSSPQLVNLTGLGATMSVSPTSLVFASQALGTTSAPQSITVTNTSKKPVALGNVSITGTYNFGNFAQTNNCSGTLQPNGTCTVQVTFTPAGLGLTSGPVDVLVRYQQLDSPLAVGLSGSGGFSTNNTVPQIGQPLQPVSVVPGGAPFSLQVTGTGITSSSIVNWNGTPLVSKATGKRILQGTVPSANIASAGTAVITVTTPGPGGGTSTAAFLPITTPAASVSFAPQSIGVGTGPQGIVIGDFNRDGIMDLAVADQGTTSGGSSISILLGNGDGTFSPGATLSLPTGSLPGPMVAGDFNGDGILDLAVGDTLSSRIQIFVGVGNGTFNAAGLVNCTLLMDCGNTVQPVSLAVGDFNHDGHLDLAVINATVNTLSVFLGNGDGTLKAQSTAQFTFTQPVAAVAGDINNDAVMDLLVADAAGNAVFALASNGDGTFKKTATISTTDPVALVMADFNGDGNLDVAVVNGTSNTVTIFFGTGKGTFGTGVAYATGAGPSSIVVGDFNGDGVLDIATVNGSSNSVSVLLGVKGGTFQTAIPFTTGGNPVSAVVGDFNGNGKLDLAVTESLGNSVGILLQ